MFRITAQANTLIFGSRKDMMDYVDAVSRAIGSTYDWSSPFLLRQVEQITVNLIHDDAEFESDEEREARKKVEEAAALAAEEAKGSAESESGEDQPTDSES